VLWQAVIKFIIVQIQQLIVWRLLSLVKQVLNNTWIKSSAKLVKYVSPVKIQTWHKLSIILHAWFKKFAETDSLPTTSFKISKKLAWCKKLSAHSSVIRLIDLIAEYWTNLESSLRRDTNFTNEASTNCCFLSSAVPIKNEANALILACLYLGLVWSIVLDVKSRTNF